jgi:hypothetical protein
LGQRRRSDRQLSLWPASSLTFGKGLLETYGVNTDYQVTSIKLTPATGALIDRTLAWTGEEPNSITDAVTAVHRENPRGPVPRRDSGFIWRNFWSQSARACRSVSRRLILFPQSFELAIPTC